jgi:UrcA family protein
MTMNSSKWISLAAVAAIGWQALPSIAQAGEPGLDTDSHGPLVVQTHAAHDVLERRVPYRDLDLSEPAGRETLFRRIDTAVEQVCPETDTRNLRMIASQRECETAAYAQAMAQVDKLIAERMARR